VVRHENDLVTSLVDMQRLAQFFANLGFGHSEFGTANTDGFADEVVGLSCRRGSGRI
jgi:hypothetical protein